MDAGYGQDRATDTVTECSNPDPDKTEKWCIGGHIGHLWAKYPKVCKSITSVTAMTFPARVGQTVSTGDAAIQPT